MSRTWAKLAEKKLDGFEPTGQIWWSVVGIDPGMTGSAIEVHVSPASVVLTKFMNLEPVPVPGSKRKRLGFEQLVKFFGRHASLPSLIVLEAVQSMPPNLVRNGVPVNSRRSEWQLARAYGATEVVAHLFGGQADIMRLPPPAWKNTFGLARKPKEEARSVAKAIVRGNLVEAHDPFRLKAKGLSVAESCLIALSGWLRWVRMAEQRGQNGG